MPTFPTISSGSMKVYSPLGSQALAMYPATINHSYLTRVLKFINDSEQRWVVRNELFSAMLDFHDLPGYDLSVLVDFFQTMRGMYVDTVLLNVFDITLDGVNYQWCAFDQDELSVQSDRNLNFACQFNIRQVRPN